MFLTLTIRPQLTYGSLLFVQTGGGLEMYGGSNITLPSTGVGIAAGASAFAGYMLLASVLALVMVLLLLGSAYLMRSGR